MNDFSDDDFFKCTYTEFSKICKEKAVKLFQKFDEENKDSNKIFLCEEHFKIFKDTGGFNDNYFSDILFLEDTVVESESKSLADEDKKYLVLTFEILYVDQKSGGAFKQPVTFITDAVLTDFLIWINLTSDNKVLISEGIYLAEKSSLLNSQEVFLSSDKSVSFLDWCMSFHFNPVKIVLKKDIDDLIDRTFYLVELDD